MVSSDPNQQKVDREGRGEQTFASVETWWVTSLGRMGLSFIYTGETAESGQEISHEQTQSLNDTIANIKTSMMVWVYPKDTMH